VLMPPLLPSPLEEVIQNDNQSKTWCWQWTQGGRWAEEGLHNNKNNNKERRGNADDYNDSPPSSASSQSKKAVTAEDSKEDDIDGDGNHYCLVGRAG
jgi:hypothetical protein